MRGALLLFLTVGYLCYTSAAVAVSIPVTDQFIGFGDAPPLDASPAPCKTPLQWEGRYSEWDHKSATNNRFNISFDGTKRRKWIEEQQKSMRPGRRLFKFLILYDEKVEYKIDLKYKTCSKIAMGPWRNFSIPPNAIFEDEYQIGGPQGNLDVTEWSDRQPARSRESWIGGFTQVGCWPVFDIFTFENETVSVGYTTRFFDLTPGIRNMSVFDVPELCKTTTAATPSRETPGKDDDKTGLWDRWVPKWFKKWFDKQKIDNGGQIPTYGIPTAEIPEPEVPDQDGAYPLPDYPTFNPDNYQYKQYAKNKTPWSPRKP